MIVAGKAGAIVPGVLEKHSVRELGANGKFPLRENEIRHLREAVACDGIGTDDLDVARRSIRREVRFLIQYGENLRRHAGNRPGATNRGRLLLDVSWRQPEITDVDLGDAGVDRITVRLASLIIGASQPGWGRIDEASRLDWEFVRPTGQKTDPAAVLVAQTCSGCGGPYRSDFDDTCAHCQAPRPDGQGGWRLNSNYFVVDV